MVIEMIGDKVSLNDEQYLMKKNLSYIPRVRMCNFSTKIQKNMIAF